MAIVNMRDMLYHAYKNGYAVGAFDLVSLDFLEAVINAAERCRAPVILSLAEPHFKHYDFELMMSAVEAAAKRAAIPVAIQLDHGASLNSAIHAINHGCNGIMVDSTQQQLPQNIEATRAVVEMAHACGVAVVGELGYVAGIDGEEAEHHPGEVIYTVPAEAKIFVERTGVDFLAVSIGTTRGRVKGRSKLDFARLKQIQSAVEMPLVIHGGSGLTEDQFRRLTSMGVAKINYFTALSDVAAEAMRIQMKSNPCGSFIDIKRGVKEAIGTEVERCLKLWASAGRAAEVLAQCEPWGPIERLIIYNVEGSMTRSSNEMMAEGRRVLRTIPGVREVFSGETVKQESRYQYCWRISFAHLKVIESYRNHPIHVEFFNTLFRPLTSDAISIDYRTVNDASPVGVREGSGALKSGYLAGVT